MRCNTQCRFSLGGFRRFGFVAGLDISGQVFLIEYAKEGAILKANEDGMASGFLLGKVLTIFDQDGADIAGAAVVGLDIEEHFRRHDFLQWLGLWLGLSRSVVGIFYTPYPLYFV